MAQSSQIQPENLSRLVPICPHLIDYLRNNSTHTADLFLQSNAEDYEKVDRNLRRFLAEVKTKGDVSLADLQRFCSEDVDGDALPLSVWASAVRLIMTQATPKLISAKLGSELISSLQKLNEAATVKECCLILGPLLDKLPRKHFDALGEFCALIRDTSSNTSIMACLVGPTIILSSSELNSPTIHASSIIAAAALFDLFIAIAEPLFGRSAAERTYHAWGSFRRQNEVDVRVNFRESLVDKEQKVLKRSLRAFYDWLDPACAFHVDTLFDVYPFQSIATAIHEKYTLLPPGWAELINALGNHVDFGPKDFKIVRGTISENYVKKHIEMNPVVIRNIGRVKVDDIIDEIINNERLFHDQINAIVEYFGVQLREIVEGRRGEDRRVGLSLDQDEVEIICGANLRAVRNVSGNLLAKLEVLSLVKSNPVDAAGRAELLVGSYSEILREMRGSYFSFVGNYPKASAMITKKKDQLNKLKKSKQQYHFMRIWQVISSSLDVLQGKRLDSLLIKPVQRVYQTKLMFERLLKEYEKLVQDQTRLSKHMMQLCSDISTLATDLNTHMAEAKNGMS